MEKKEIDELQISIKNYLSTNYELMKLESGEKISVVSASLLGNMLVAMLVALFILFSSFTLAFFVSVKLENYYYGFGGVAVLYLLAALILRFAVKSSVERSIRELLIRKMFTSTSK